MQHILLIVLMAVSTVYVVAQDDERLRNAEQVRSVVRNLAADSRKATILTRKLVVYSGKVVAANVDSFDLKVGKHKSAIRYDDVLELDGAEKLSFTPDGAARNHGVWDDVRKYIPAPEFSSCLLMARR